jgi:type IV secretion system protein VirB11
MMAGESYYLTSLLAPLAEVLGRPDVTDIYINRPGEFWIETSSGGIARHEAEALDETLLGLLVRQIAASTAQGISRASPLLAAALPDGSRVQVIAPPATRGTYAVAIRKHVAGALSLSDYADSGAFDGLAGGDVSLDAARELVAISSEQVPSLLNQAVRSRWNILVSGGTSSGKTTFLDALLRSVPSNQRLILIEDAPELTLSQPNAVGLLAARSALSEANVTAEDLLIAALRMRPDRIILGELRGREALTFLRAVNTGHPGSMTTIHADSPSRAIDQLALLVLQSGARLSWDEIRRYIRLSVDLFVHLEREGGRRRVTQVLACRDRRQAAA